MLLAQTAELQHTGWPLWLKLAVLVGANIVVFQLVLAMLKNAGDRSEPITLVRVQLGLIPPHSGRGAKSMEKLRSRLGQLTGMIQAGQQGMWLILEEAVLELSKHHHAAALADVTVVHLDSKHAAYDLFGEIHKHELNKAQVEEALAHEEGQGECATNWDGPEDASGNGSGSRQRRGLLQWLAGQPGLSGREGDSGCDDALVVTLVVAARGHMRLPSTLATWHDLCTIMKGVCGLSSDRLMAVDLIWSPSHDGAYLTRDQILTDFSNLKPIRA